MKLFKGQPSNLEEIFNIYINARKELHEKGIFQWIESYPTKELIMEDLERGFLYVLQNEEGIIGAINISEEQEKEYDSINWKNNDEKVLVIHRLVVDPEQQRKGYARKLMDFAEGLAKKEGYNSIRLDCYSQNNRVVNFYTQRGYIIRGQVRFPKRQYYFHCMEKEVL